MPAKNINLLTRKEFDQTLLGKFLRWSLTYGRYIIICTEIIVLLAFIYRFSLDRKITDLEEEIQQKSAIIVANQGFEQQFRNLQNRVDQIAKLNANQSTIVTVLHHLESITPTGITYKSFQFAEGKIIVSATAQTNSSLALFLYKLKTSNLLTNINVPSLSRGNASLGEIVFSVDALVKNAAPITLKL